eukprot:2966372-Amphidinium_carterae.3
MFKTGVFIFWWLGGGYSRHGWDALTQNLTMASLDTPSAVSAPSLWDILAMVPRKSSSLCQSEQTGLSQHVKGHLTGAREEELVAPWSATCSQSGFKQPTSKRGQLT